MLRQRGVTKAGWVCVLAGAVALAGGTLMYLSAESGDKQTVVSRPAGVTAQAPPTVEPPPKPTKASSAGSTRSEVTPRAPRSATESAPGESRSGREKPPVKKKAPVTG